MKAILTVPILFISATAAMAQDTQTGACGQPAALNVAQMDFAGAPEQTTGTFIDIRRNEPRYIELNVTAQAGLVMRTDSGAADTTLALYDTEGNLISFNDDFGDTSNARLVENLAPGTYCLQVGKYADAAQARATIPVAISAAPDEDACISQSTDSIPASATMDPYIHTGSMSGAYRLAVDVAPNTPLRIEARSTAFDTKLRIEDAMGNILGENDDYGEGTDSMVELPASAEATRMCIQVQPYSEGSGAYALAVSPGQSSQMPEQAGDATRLPESQPDMPQDTGGEAQPSDTGVGAPVPVE